MPRYNVTVAMTLRITKVITVRAKDEETAEARVGQMIEPTQFGALAWEVHDDHSSNGWEEEELNVFIDSIEEEECASTSPPSKNGWKNSGTSARA